MPFWIISAHLRYQTTGKLFYAERCDITLPRQEPEQRRVVADWSFGSLLGAGISLDREYYEAYTARAVTWEDWKAWTRQHRDGIVWRCLADDTACN